MMFNPWAAVAGIVGVISIFGLGVKLGTEFESGKADGKLLQAMQAASDVVDIKNGELEQCRASVAAINETVAQQGKKLARAYANDSAARRKAEAEARERDQANQERQKAVIEALTKLKGGIENADFGVCAGERADSDYIGLLNETLATARGGD